MDDLIVPSTPPPTADSEEMQENLLAPEYAVQRSEHLME